MKEKFYIFNFLKKIKGQMWMSNLIWININTMGMKRHLYHATLNHTKDHAKSLMYQYFKKNSSLERITHGWKWQHGWYIILH